MDDEELLHDLLLVQLLALCILLLELLLHHVSEKLHVLHSASLNFWHGSHLFRYGRHQLLFGERAIIDAHDQNGAINTSDVEDGKGL